MIFAGEKFLPIRAESMHEFALAIKLSLRRKPLRFAFAGPLDSRARRTPPLIERRWSAGERDGVGNGWMTTIDSNIDGQWASASWPRRMMAAAPWVFGASLVFRLVGSVMVYADLYPDLRVYVVGGAAVTHPGTLYDAFSIDGVGQHLPFTYPPFAAILNYPLHLVPFVVVAFVWTAATVAALYGVVRISQRMTNGGSRRVAMLWTTAAMWFEPVRSTLDLGQVNVFLLLAVLYAAYTSKWWLSGLLIGAAAGVKLTPAIAGVYLMGMRRWAAVCASVAAFAATIGVAALVNPQDTKLYFTHLLGDVRRIGTVDYAPNQSWQGTISRIVGYDTGRGALLFIAIAGTAVLALFAWRALGAASGGRDALGSLLVVQLFGLTASPISWVHHWVWVVPLMIWLFHGPWRDAGRAVFVRWAWILALVVGVPTLLSREPQDWSRPWYLAWAEAVYVPLTIITLAWIVAVGRRRSADARSFSRVRRDISPPVNHPVGAVGLALGWRPPGSATRN